MSMLLFVLAYTIVGAVMVETARIWFGMWWLEMTLGSVLFWPVIALCALLGKHHDGGGQ